MTIRTYVPDDRAEWRRMRTAMWPDQSPEDMDRWLDRPDAVTLVAERSTGGLCGFAEAGARSYAEGCMTDPVAYLEGWYVDPDVRGQGVGGALIAAVESWARAGGYAELGSDADPDNRVSQAAHESLGFTEVGRAVLYRKQL